MCRPTKLHPFVTTTRSALICHWRHKRELCSTRAHLMMTHRNSRKLHGGGRGRRRLQRSVIDLHVRRIRQAR